MITLSSINDMIMLDMNSKSDSLVIKHDTIDPRDDIITIVRIQIVVF